MAANILGSPDHIPDLVIDNILKRLPTKIACQVRFLSKQWEAPMSSNPILDLDEGDDIDRCNLRRYSDYVHQHKRFINFLRGYSEHRDKKKLIDKLRLHMRTFVCPSHLDTQVQDFEAIHRWVELAIEGDVKELDISPKRELIVEKYLYYNWYYWLPWTTFVNAKSLTSLKLEFMIVPEIHLLCDHTLLPSLKTVSLTSVILYGRSFFPLLLATSSIEYVSLTACCFEYQHDYICYVKSSSLKCLEVKDCRGLWSIYVHDSMNLESLTFVSPCWVMMVHNAPKLKRIDICSDVLLRLYLYQCNRELKATINTQMLELFLFIGSLEAQVSVKAHKTRLESVISVSELWDEEWFLSNSTTNFHALMAFLKGFECSKSVWLLTRDSKALIIPESFRKTIGTFPTPLPRGCDLNVVVPNPPMPRSRDYLDLMNSINWIKQPACIARTHPLWLVHFIEFDRLASKGAA